MTLSTRPIDFMSTGTPTKTKRSESMKSNRRQLWLQRALTLAVVGFSTARAEDGCRSSHY
jgi:hypothetical protein